MKTSELYMRVMVYLDSAHIDWRESGASAIAARRLMCRFECSRATAYRMLRTYFDVRCIQSAEVEA